MGKWETINLNEVRGVEKWFNAKSKWYTRLASNIKSSEELIFDWAGERVRGDMMLTDAMQMAFCFWPLGLSRFIRSIRVGRQQSQSKLSKWHQPRGVDDDDWTHNSRWRSTSSESSSSARFHPAPESSLTSRRSRPTSRRLWDNFCQQNVLLSSLHILGSIEVVSKKCNEFHDNISAFEQKTLRKLVKHFQPAKSRICPLSAAPRSSCRVCCYT